MEMKCSEGNVLKDISLLLSQAAQRKKPSALKGIISFVGAVSCGMNHCEGHYTTSFSLAVHSHHFNN